ncbi:hypothetical protein [Psychroserpens sp.]|uniref:hypothetical protein n=1 Tax=Psychroserpens sp. TaxID=2020870 RepID=UPI003C7365B5
MKYRILYVATLIAFMLFTSCSNDDSDSDDALNGTWRLTEFNSFMPLDLNNDGTPSINLLTEIDCLENETLVFESNNIVVSNNTSFFDIEIDLEIGTTNEFIYSVNCEEDIYSFTMTYTQDGATVILNDDGDLSVGLINGNTLSFTFEGDLDIENENGDETSGDFILVYTKQ